jgi:polyhydroxyalkanoate synthesis repressor PhaR
MSICTALIVHRKKDLSRVETGKIIIKKYGNRRLYDTSGSRYVNLEEIAAQVRNGKDVQVLDAKTGEDLTRVILTQIILEDAKGQPSGLPTELLRQLVVATDRVGRDFLMWYLKSAFDAYHKVHDSVQTRISEVQTAALSPLQMVKNFMQRESAPAKPAGSDNELEQLRRRIAELEARMGEPPARAHADKAAKKKTGKPRSKSSQH